jgi:DNA-binding XRE family transcriptional regulator
MNTLEANHAPTPEESLAGYVRRIRTTLGLSQRDLAERAGLHLQSVGKLERGQTAKLNRKTQSGLAQALQLPVEYLEAMSRGIAVEPAAVIKFCPSCWIPGTPPESVWLNPRAQCCFLCGTTLRSRCSQCQAAILSLSHRFCPYCGNAYKPSRLAD